MSLSPHHACMHRVCVAGACASVQERRGHAQRLHQICKAANYRGQETFQSTLKPIGTGGCMHAHLFSSRSRMVTGWWICWIHTAAILEFVVPHPTNPSQPTRFVYHRAGGSKVTSPILRSTYRRRRHLDLQILFLHRDQLHALTFQEPSMLSYLSLACSLPFLWHSITFLCLPMFSSFSPIIVSSAWQGDAQKKPKCMHASTTQQKPVRYK